jgi:photosystem II stability/assembly factor-like uncharacterized protein
VTSDAGQHWTPAFVNDDPNAFYDCMTFFDKRRGLALSDPPDGVKFHVISTSDGGQSWHVVDPAGMPPALPGEFAFAASGQCIPRITATAPGSELAGRRRPGSSAPTIAAEPGA